MSVVPRLVALYRGVVEQIYGLELVAHMGIIPALVHAVTVSKTTLTTSSYFK